MAHNDKLVNPQVLYLQNKETDTIDEHSWVPKDELDVTWSKDEINKNDEVYIRADLVDERTLEMLGISKERAGI